MSEYTLRFDDYLYEPYKHNGLSGTIYLAAPKGGEGKRYLVKNEYANCGCNEFMFSRVAALLGLNTPECRLFAFSNQKGAHAFRYAAAIEYIENATAPKLEEIRRNPEDLRQYVLSHIARVFFADDDRVEFVRSADGRLVSIDFTEAFDVNHILVFVSDNDAPENPFLAKLRNPGLSRYVNQLPNIEKVFVKNGICSSDAFYDVLYDFGIGFLNPDQTAVREMLDALSQVYPRLIVDYFEGFLLAIRTYFEKLLHN